ncbi:NUDIX hydrolase [Flavobacterium sedimenticola]|uniref:NUDIX domain-containing protein n=1 Tax=Flavobacterium sedimenticola TaxID=3043286 RepID=A0ABT6XSU6_9FLAO|nr:NUDIX domain-containing protein [Flavobacterium sedimenticola]MDI9258174.1 NUDIX domain-containing protein [Flavobacterium sedimenticola]
MKADTPNHNGLKTLRTSGLVVIKNNKVLLTFSKNKKAWYLPGGKIELNETAVEALIRESKEELNLTLQPSELHFLTTIKARAFGEENVIMIQDCFMHNLQQPIQPLAEIAAIKYFDYHAYRKEPQQVEGVIKIMEWLKLLK